MGRFNWGREGPPEEAYSRVTEQERFSPLHEWTLDFVSHLETHYEIAREESRGLDPELETVPLARETVRITPRNDTAAPITIAFTDFPGLAVRFGRWATEFFPSCGCDACDEMPDEEFERFRESATDVVAGRFRESLHLGWRGDGWRNAEFWSDGHRRSRRGTRVSRGMASEILNGRGEIALGWKPWPPLENGPSTP